MSRWEASETEHALAPGRSDAGVPLLMNKHINDYIYICTSFYEVMYHLWEFI